MARTSQRMENRFMPTFYYPLLTRENYAAFKVLIPDLPDTFDLWEFKIEQDKSRENHAWQTGFEAKDVPIDPVEFKRYCQACNETPTCSVLRRFARIKRGESESA